MAAVDPVIVTSGLTNGFVHHVDEPALGISGVIVAVIWAVIAAILAFAGKSQIDKMQGLEQTQETVQKIPNAVTGHEERNR